MATRGRPRDAKVDDAALHATVELIAEAGYPGLGMDRVAERAGVSKAALYRRWPNKLALAVDAIRDFAHTRIPVPDTGSLRADMTAYLRSMVSSRRTEVATYQALAAALATDAELAERCRDALIGHFTDGFRTLVERGVGRGELPAGTDVELYADLAPALIRLRRDTTGERLDDALVERIVNQFFPPATTPAGPRPAPRRAPATGAGARR